MFRFSTITVAFLLVLAGMKITIASHYCQGSLAKTIVSLNGTSASCGMEHAESSEDKTIISSRCCDNEQSVYNIGDDYTPSDLRYNHLFQTIDYLSPELILPASSLTALPKQTNNSPPGRFLVTAVRAADICVFRI